METPAERRGEGRSNPGQSAQLCRMVRAGSTGEGTQGRRARRIAGLGLQRCCRRGLTHQLMVPNLALLLGSSAATRSSGITSGFSQSPGSDVDPRPLCPEEAAGLARPGVLTLPPPPPPLRAACESPWRGDSGLGPWRGHQGPWARFLPSTLTCKFFSADYMCRVTGFFCL